MKKGTLEIRNGWTLEMTTRTKDKDTKRVVQPIRIKRDGFQIAFGNQTIFLRLKSRRTGRRLSALRPYLTAGLPLSVQSLLKN